MAQPADGNGRVVMENGRVVMENGRVVMENGRVVMENGKVVGCGLINPERAHRMQGGRGGRNRRKGGGSMLWHNCSISASCLGVAR